MNFQFFGQCSKSTQLVLINFFLLIVLFENSSLAQEKDDYYPVRIDYKWGAIDAKGKVILSPKYEYVGKFNSQDLAIVKLQGKYGVVDINGKQILTPAFDNIRFTKKQVALVAKDAKWGIANLRDSTITPTNFDLIKETKQGYFKVFSDSLEGLCNSDGSLICPPSFAKINLSKEPFFFFLKDGKRGMGTTVVQPEKDFIIIPPSFDSLAFIDDELIVCIRDSLAGVYNQFGKEILAHNYETVSKLGKESKYLKIRNKGKYGVSSKSGEQLIPPKYDFVVDGIKNFLVSRKGFWGISDSTDNLLTKIKWKTFELYDDDFILLKDKERRSAIFSHSQKTIVFEGKIQQIKKLNRGFLEITGEEGVFIVVNSGKLLSEKAYKSFKFLSEEFIAFSQDDLWGIFDLEGNKITPCKYDLIYPFPPDFPLTKVTKNGQVGLVNKKGKELLPLIYSRVEVFNSSAKGYESNGAVRVVKFNSKGTLLDSYRLANVLSISLRGKNNVSADSIRFSNTPPTSNTWGNWNSSVGSQRSRRFIPKPFGKMRNWWALYDTQESKFAGLKDDGAFRFVYKFGRNNLFWGLKNARGVKRFYNRKGQKRHEKIGYVGTFNESLARVNVGGKYVFIENEPNLDKTYQLDNVRDFFSNRFLSHLKISYIKINFTDVPFCDGGSWGFMNFKGQMVIPPDYDFVHDFIEGQAIAEKNGKWGVIDKDNEIVIPFEYSHISLVKNSKERLYLLRKEEMLLGYIDTLGRQVVPTNYLALNEYRDGLAKVLTETGWGFIDKNGEIIIADTLEGVKDFCEGLAAFRKENLWGFIDKNGRTVIKPIYQEVGNFQNGMTWVKIKGRKGIINKDGKEVIPPKYYKIEDFENGLARVYVKGKWGLVDKNGKWVVSPKYSKILSFEENGLAKFKHKSWGLMDTLGNIILKPKYNKIGEFNEGVAYVRTSGNNFRNLKYGYIDLKGRYVIRPKFRLVGDFSDGLARARMRKSPLWGYINREGKFEIPPDFYGAEDFNEDVAVVYTKPGRKEGALFIDKKGNALNKGYFTPLKTYHEGRAVVKQGDYVNYIDSEGNLILKELNIDASNFQYKVAFIKKTNHRWALVDQLCIPLTEAKFDQISSFNKDKLAKVGILLKYGVANRNGEILIEANCDDILPYDDEVIQLKRGDEIGYMDITGQWIWHFRK